MVPYAVTATLCAFFTVTIQAADDGGAVVQTPVLISLAKITGFDSIEGMIPDLQPGKTYHVTIEGMDLETPLYDPAAPFEFGDMYHPESGVVGCQMYYPVSPGDKERVKSDSAWYHVLSPFLFHTLGPVQEIQERIQVKFSTEPRLECDQEQHQGYKAVVVIDPKSISVGPMARDLVQDGIELRQHSQDKFDDPFWVRIPPTDIHPRLNVRYSVSKGVVRPESFRFVENFMEDGGDKNKFELPAGWTVIPIDSIKDLQVREMSGGSEAMVRQGVVWEVSFANQVAEHGRIVWEVNEVQAEYLRRVAARGELIEAAIQGQDREILIKTISGNLNVKYPPAEVMQKWREMA